MKKQLAIILIGFFIISAPLSTGVFSNINNRISPQSIWLRNSDWYDGTFNGAWGTNETPILGNFTGNLNLGRSSQIGRFKAIWSNNNNTEYGNISGFFRKTYVFGRFSNDITEEKMLFIGKYFFNDTHFNAIIRSKQGTIYVKGTHSESFLPSLTGDYDVGTRKFHLIDENRTEEFTPDNPDDYREMMMQLWYPIDKDTSTERIDYMDERTFQWLRDRSPIPLITITKNAYLSVRPYSKGNNSIATEPEMFPLIIFSPGYTGVYELYTSLIEDIASHGFIVASINHPYISGITVFPDGRTIETAPVPTDPDEITAYFELGMNSVVGDAKFVLDQLSEMNNSDLFLSGHIDTSKVGMYGHSFGGGSTAQCCHDDPRFKAGLTLDGYFTNLTITNSIDKPFVLMLQEGRLENDSDIEFIWDHLDNDAYKIEITGSSHQAFTDAGILLSHYVPLIPERLLGFGKIDPKRMINITKSFEIAFFEVYLKDYPLDTILDLFDLYPEVNYQYKFD